MAGLNTVDVLNTTLQQLNKSLLETLESFTPTLTILGKRERNYAGGTHIERIISGEATGKAFGVTTPGMRFTFSSQQTARRIRVATHRIVLTFAIPKSDLVINKGAAQIIDIQKMKVGPTLKQFRNELNSHFVMGTHSYSPAVGLPEVYNGLITLNGDVSGAPVEGAEAGLFDAATFASQSDSVQSLTKSSLYRWANQYGACSSFAGDFLSTFASLQRECRRYSTASGPPAGPKVMISDSGTFQNLALYAYNRAVPYSQAEAMKGGDILSANTLPFLGVEWVDEPAIVLSGFTTAALTRGCVYGIKPEHFDLQFSTEPTISKWVDDPNSDNFIAKGEIQGAMACVGGLADQFLMAGSAV